MADLMDGFEGSLKPSRNNGPETNRNHAETSMKPSETKVAGHRRNRETAPLKGAVAGFGTHTAAARGSLLMSTTPSETQSSAARTRRYRERRRQTRCVTVNVNKDELDALVVRGYLPEEDRDNGAAIKMAIEAVLSDIELDLQSETAERTRVRG